jgi:hypothetical protein
MRDIERRLSRLEDAERLVPADEHQREEERKRRIREQAEHVNRCRERGALPLFEIAENGDVFCTHDGRPVTDSRQVLAEEFYWQTLGWGGPGLVHDEEAEAFYTPSGDLALSREYVNLQHLLKS